MIEFKKWLRLTQDGWVKDIDGKTWPSFGGLNTINEAEAAEDGWVAALRWALTKDTDLNATELADAMEKELYGKT